MLSTELMCNIDSVVPPGRVFAWRVGIPPIKMNMQINDMKAELNKSIVEVEKRQLSIEKIQSEIDSFPKDIENLDEEAIKKIAREKLNLQDSDVIIFANSQPN